MLTARRKSLRDFLKERMSDVDTSILPKKAKIIGHVALIRLSEDFPESKIKEIGKYVMDFYPNVRTVLRIRRIEGYTRRPIVDFVYGDPNTETIHKEYGYSFMLDVSKLMLCLGNSYERLMTARSVKDGEIIVDMFAGIGQFSIPCAVIGKPSRVYAIEINEEAFRYLKLNISLNRVEKIVIPILGDCKIVTPKLGVYADRIIMGYFGGTIEALPAALSICKPSGTIIHFHELVRRGNGMKKLFEDVSNLCSNAGYQVSLLESRVVKSYSATKEHALLILNVSKAE